mgnify:CR=1 FL=1
MKLRNPPCVKSHLSPLVAGKFCLAARINAVLGKRAAVRALRVKDMRSGPTH